VVFGLLPFNRPALILEEQLDGLEAAARQFPSILDTVDMVKSLVSYLIENPDNPKSNRVITLLGDYDRGKKRPTGLLSPRSRLALPGWGEHMQEFLRDHGADVQLVSSVKQISMGNFCRLILPWGGRGCPFLYQLFHCYCTPTIHTFVYCCERAVRPEKRALPTGAPFPVKLWSGSARHDLETTEDHGEPDWRKADFWTALRSESAAPDASDTEGKQFFLRARLVLLANENKIFLNESSKVIEVSALVEGEEDPGDSNRFPRRRVKDLRPGDLIVLRTSGSGDYLISVADSLMAKDGKKNLRKQALDWKHALRLALEELGSQIIASLLEGKGHGVQSSHRYIWVWTTRDVIRPRSEGQFYEILAILQDLGYLEEEALETAENRWALMKEIISYHHRAGLQIREALLRRLRKLVRAGERIDESLALKLPGVDSGELTVLRVSAVDPDAIEVPHHRIGTILALYE
jgi:hypothetical protein